MNEITNHAELTVEKKKEGKYLLKRILMNASYWALPILLILITSIISEIEINGERGPDFVMLAILFIPVWIFLCPKLVRPLTFIYVDIEEKMDISGGTLTLSKIMGKRKKKDYIAVKVSELEVIKPYRDEYRQEADTYNADVRIECVASMKGADVYFAYYTNEEGKNVLMFFEATEKALRVMKFLNSKTVVAEVSR